MLLDQENLTAALIRSSSQELCLTDSHLAFFLNSRAFNDT